MKNSLLALTLASIAIAPVASAADRKPPTVIDALGIISDVDDTVRPTGTLHIARAIEVASGLKKVDAFAGMAELYDQLLAAPRANVSTDEMFVSGAPIILKEDLKPYLSEHGFFTSHVKTNDASPFVSTKKFKEGQFKTILKANPKTSFYFFGDDTQSDPDAIADARKNFPLQIHGAYIHTIEGVNCAFPTTIDTAKTKKPCPAGLTPYYTSIEIALREMKAGNLTVDQVGVVAQAMVKADDYSENVVPKYARICPKAGFLDQTLTDLGYLPVPQTGDPLTEQLRAQLADIQTRVAAVCTADRAPEPDAPAPAGALPVRD
jgi:hypothetical protein